MTHGGLLGSSEAAYYGIPVVVTPIFGDQFLNAAAIESRKMGKILNYDDISVNNVKAAIQYALQRETKENAKKVSFDFQIRPLSAIESAIWWTEHVGKTKGFPLGESNCKQLSSFVFYSMDIYCIFIIFLFLCIIFNYFLIKKCCSKKIKIKNKKN